MRQGEYGCNRWCVELRGRLADRADTAERAVRGLTSEVRALRAEISRLKEAPTEREILLGKYHKFRARAWILLGVILIVLGTGIITAVLAAEHLIESTTFVGWGSG